MAVRSAMHHAGASALTELLQFPDTGRRAAQSCLVLAAIRRITGNCAPSQFSPPWARCTSRVPIICARTVTRASFPTDVELDIENTELSPGVRRMQAWSARRRPSITAAQQMKLLAGLEVTTKAVERTAEAIGERYRRKRDRRRSSAPCNWICP